MQENQKDYRLTEEDLLQFTQAKTYEEQLKILVEHSQRNLKRIQIRRINKMGYNQKEVEKEMLELNNQFKEFLHTKGIKAKFKLAISNMQESAKQQHAADVASFQEVKAKSIEENKDFVEFLHTKGIKAKFKLVIENIKKGARESSQKTAAQIASAKAHQAPIKESINVEDIEKYFNEFLKSKGLDTEYKVEIVEN